MTNYKTFLRSEKYPHISVAVLADSISHNNKRIVSWELTLPRYIWAEFLTHRLMSRNAASSRAIPVKKKIAMIWDNPTTPIIWGKNKSGMQSEGELEGIRLFLAKGIWYLGSKLVCGIAWSLSKLGLHKQWVGRWLEVVEEYKVVVTSTEYDNLFKLRIHKDAQPEINELVSLMKKAMEVSKPQRLNPGEWHLPYIKTFIENGKLIYAVPSEKDPVKYDIIDLDTAKKISTSCCAQVSYRNLNQTEEKALDIYDKLVKAEVFHASPFEHQATPMVIDKFDPIGYPEKGITGVYFPTNSYVSGNFVGWIQHRHLVE